VKPESESIESIYMAYKSGEQQWHRNLTHEKRESVPRENAERKSQAGSIVQAVKTRNSPIVTQRGMAETPERETAGE